MTCWCGRPTHPGPHLTSPVPPRPAAPDATAGDDLRSEMWSAAEEAIAAYMLSGSRTLGTRWSASDAEDLGAIAIDAVLALPALRDVLAAAARDAEKVRRVEALLARYRYPTREGLLAALDPS